MSIPLVRNQLIPPLKAKTSVILTSSSPALVDLGLQIVPRSVASHVAVAREGPIAGRTRYSGITRRYGP